MRCRDLLQRAGLRDPALAKADWGCRFTAAAPSLDWPGFSNLPPTGAAPPRPAPPDQSRRGGIPDTAPHGHLEVTQVDSCINSPL